MRHKSISSLLKALAIALLFLNMYHPSATRNWYKSLVKYVVIDKDKLFSLHSIHGAVQFILPFISNELIVLLLIYAFFGRRDFITIYLKFSALFIAIVLILRVVGHLSHTKTLLDFAGRTYNFGIGAVWPLFILAFFYQLSQSERFKKKLA